MIRLRLDLASRTRARRESGRTPLRVSDGRAPPVVRGLSRGWTRREERGTATYATRTARQPQVEVRIRRAIADVIVQRDGGVTATAVRVCHAAARGSRSRSVRSLVTAPQCAHAHGTWLRLTTDMVLTGEWVARRLVRVTAADATDHEPRTTDHSRPLIGLPSARKTILTFAVDQTLLVIGLRDYPERQNSIRGAVRRGLPPSVGIGNSSTPPKRAFTFTSGNFETVLYPPISPVAPTEAPNPSTHHTQGEEEADRRQMIED